MKSTENRLDEQTRTWRKGIWAVLKKNLKCQSHFALLESAVYTLRSSTAVLFSVLMKALLDFLQIEGEVEVCKALKTHYLQENDGVLSATWRSSPDRCIPSQCPASQAQESWHRHRARPSLESKGQSLGAAVSKLQRFLQTRALLVESKQVIHSVPAVKWPPDLVRGLLFSLELPIGSSKELMTISY